MPRITAPTLAEHRESRRSALLVAGSDLLDLGGPQAVTMAAVAARSGLSRPAVYEYFASTEDLLIAVIGERMREWAGRIADAVHEAATPEAKIAAYVRASLALIAADGAPLAAMMAWRLPDDVRDRVARLHRALSAPLIQALEAMGVPDVELGLRFIQSATEAAARRMPTDTQRDEITNAACAFVIGGLRSLAKSGSAA